MKTCLYQADLLWFVFPGNSLSNFISLTLCHGASPPLFYFLLYLIPVIPPLLFSPRLHSAFLTLTNAVNISSQCTFTWLTELKCQEKILDLTNKNV